MGRPRRLTHCNAASPCNAQAFAVARLANVTSMRKVVTLTFVRYRLTHCYTDTATLTLLHKDYINTK